MRFLRYLTRLFLAITLTTLPLQAHANGTDIQNIFLNLITSFAGPILVTVAILSIVIAGFTLLISQEEGARDKAKKTIMAVIIGGLIATIIVFFPGGPRGAIGIVYNGVAGTFFLNTASTLGVEAVGVSGWIAAMAVMIGIVIIILSVIRAIGSFGGDEAAYTNVRTAVLHVIIGLILIGGAALVQSTLFGSAFGPRQVVTGSLNIQPNPLIALITGKLLILLGFILLIAVAILIYAGFRMVVSFGREEDYTAAKSLAFRIVIGLIVILVSYTLVIVVSRIFN